MTYTVTLLFVAELIFKFGKHFHFLPSLTVYLFQLLVKGWATD